MTDAYRPIPEPPPKRLCSACRIALGRPCDDSWCPAYRDPYRKVPEQPRQVFCKDCQFYWHWKPSGSTCVRPTGRRDPVDGSIINTYRDAWLTNSNANCVCPDFKASPPKLTLGERFRAMFGGGNR